MKRIHDVRDNGVAPKIYVTHGTLPGLSNVTAAGNANITSSTPVAVSTLISKIPAKAYSHRMALSLTKACTSRDCEPLSLTQLSLNLTSSSKKRCNLCEKFRIGDLCSFQRLVDLLSCQEIDSYLPDLAVTIDNVLQLHFSSLEQIGNQQLSQNANVFLSDDVTDNTKSSRLRELPNAIHFKSWDTLKWQHLDLLNYIITHPKIKHEHLPLETLKNIFLYLSCRNESKDSMALLLKINSINQDYLLLIKALTYSTLIPALSVDENPDAHADNTQHI